MKRAPRKSKGRTVQRVLRQVRTNLQKTLVQQIAQYKEYLVAAHIEGWPYTVQVVVEVPEDLVERLKEQGRRRLEEKLKDQLSPDARLQVAAQEGVEQPQVDRPAGKGFRTSDHIQATPDPLPPETEYVEEATE